MSGSWNCRCGWVANYHEYCGYCGGRWPFDPKPASKQQPEKTPADSQQMPESKDPRLAPRV